MLKVEQFMQHSTLISIKSHKTQPTIKDIEYFVGLRMLIIEEALACAQAIVGSIDVHLR
jgi:hypothetical protein